MDRWDLRRNKVEDDSYAALDKATGTIYLVGDITLKQASQFRQQLRILEKLKKNPAVLVEINSHGGDIEAGFMIIDSIMLAKKPVTTRVTGVAMSMGALILSSGEIREALPNSTIMVHQGSYRFTGRFNDMHSEVGECHRLESLCSDYLDRRTGHPQGYWAARAGTANLYLTAEQALEEKLIHSILRRS